MFGLTKQSSLDAANRKLADAAKLATKQAERIRGLEAALEFSTDLATKRAKKIIRLEADVEQQSSKITTLSNLNTKLERQLAPFKSPRRRDHRGWFLPSNEGARA